MKQLVSLIIPNYNKAKFIAETLNSILYQTYFHWEAIIVDDGSSDTSKEIIDKYARKDSRFKPIFLPRQSNGGSVCRNVGLEKAKGDYVIFLDSDDILGKNCLIQRVKLLEQKRNLDFAVFTMQSFNKVIGDSNYLWSPTKERALEQFLQHDLPWQTMQPIFRKPFLEKNNLKYDEDFPRLQDVDFHTNILVRNPKFDIVNQVDCYMRIHDERKVFDSITLYQQYEDSLSKYFNKYFSSKNSKALHNTLLHGISMLIHAKNSNQLRKKEAKELVNQLLLNAISFRKKPLTFYAILGLFFPVHIPGLRFIFKKAL